ncbi:MAG: UDP-N-acetylmuramoyl-L-alanyl-D-glutamate--2,6-diaminopimelate ligase [Oscillospiraceae bacterium]|nr:UDP-N-acetylmuramoyl-L-alanyl-D-glutamate--2,6-diaminopimelate ligase [Oscillospiraceae bacterium]
MKLKELLSGVDIVRTTADPELEIGGISYDSRKTEPGDLFVAIRGFETDGHRYIAKALEKGAAAVLCEEQPEQDACPYVMAKDSRLALALCSCTLFGHPASEMRMIGVTGTSGKTSVTTLLKDVLEKTRGAKVGLIGTIGIQIGTEFLPSEHTTPESYELQKLFRRMADEGCSHVVMEVSSHALQLQRVAGFRFHTAVYTNLSQDHLDFHGNMENYAEAKRLLFSRCDTACVNLDDDWARFMIQDHACPVIGFGLSEEAQLRAENARLMPDRVCFDTVYEGRRFASELKIPGTFSVSNALSVMAAALSEGISPEESSEALKTAHGVKGRLESVPTDGNYHLLIDYSHKPDALEKVLKSLRPVTTGRLICVFGCGGDRDRLKRPLMGAISGKNADLSILTSDNPRTEDPEAIIDEIEAGIRDTGADYIRICDRVEAIHRAIDMAQDGDVILLAGKGHENYQIIGHTKRHMDEVEIVRDYILERKARTKT